MREMSFDVQDLQDLQEREPVAAEAARLSNCRIHPFCTDN
ncbi:hypothetical protein GCM10017600_31870 [Streptosporangium carneum]|uniref:Uncharacterized protein n=1 Tax=Streptosporangium carneum TaxID=47481 RepID=A0A9W6I0M1_9ACTN|nr:hypothetical protein GCM10017600_31870 [Streptosporangium carneum]